MTSNRSISSNSEMIRVVPGERFTPFSLARKLRAKVILESSSFKKGRSRYSLLLAREAFRVEQHRHSVILRSADGNSETLKDGDILDVLQRYSAIHPKLHQDLPIPAGGMGFLGYEFARFCDSFSIQERPDPLGLPLGVFLFGHLYLVFDHYSDLIYLIAINYPNFNTNLEALLDEVEHKLNDFDFNYLIPEAKPGPGTVQEDTAQKASFCAGVEKIQAEIYQGNLLQGVLSRRLEVASDISALEAYRRLRSSNPSPYMFYLDFGDYQLFGASPEAHVKIKEGKIIVRPIAGTRPRGVDEKQEAELEQELQEDEKEQAEHLMLVDLARNDIGRVAVPGSVKVTEYMQVERYSHVMHLVSQVEGDLPADKNGLDVVRATFPAGTVSGAPKIRAVSVVDTLEEMPRSFYAGLVGYVEPGGDLDSCITIRSVLKKGNRLILQAGAGVVHDSIPENEYQETNHKLGALAQAVGV